MKPLVKLMALLCLVLAAPAFADDAEPVFLPDTLELIQSLDDGTSCDTAATVERFPGADQAFMAACTITTSCSSWRYTCNGCSNNRTKRTRTCEDKCCSPGGGCLTSGQYTQTECISITC